MLIRARKDLNLRPSESESNTLIQLSYMLILYSMDIYLINQVYTNKNF